MALPASRTEFKNFCLRRLGAPVAEINVSDEQVEDAIDFCLSYYTDYHFDATEKVYYKHQITDLDKTNGYIPIPENIMGVINIFDISSALGTSSTDMFSITYQIALNDLWTFMSSSMVPYYMTMQHLRLLEQILVGQQPIRYSRHRNRLHIDMDWKKFETGNYILVEAYEIIDPAEFPDVWKDRWLIDYTTQHIKRQWGENLKKFQGMPMPGNVMFNGQQIFDEAVQKIKDMEQEMIDSYSLPSTIMYG